MPYESIGPFEEYRITCDGYRVPHLTGRVVENVMHLRLDNSCALDIPEEHANAVIWFIANALAVGAGYSCFGENSEKVNPFNRRMYGINLAEIETGCAVDDEVSQ